MRESVEFLAMNTCVNAQADGVDLTVRKKPLVPKSHVKTVEYVKTLMMDTDVIAKKGGKEKFVTKRTIVIQTHVKMEAHVTRVNLTWDQNTHVAVEKVGKARGVDREKTHVKETLALMEESVLPTKYAILRINTLDATVHLNGPEGNVTEMSMSVLQ